MEIKEKVIISPDLQMGCDPEFFFRDKNGKIVPSERVLPKDGLCASPNGSHKAIRDGVQAELNVPPSYCRELLRGNISYVFAALWQELNKPENAGITCDLKTQTVKLTKKELDALSDESKQFGCTPSYNIYDGEATVGKDGSKYRYRSAGGHLHLGVGGGVKLETLQNVKILVPLLDLIVGNTCVMIDRDKGNIIRRKTYGRAGEFRLPKYGIEYRTLSNFWLRNYTLMSLVTGLARIAVVILQKKPEYAEYLLSLVNQDDVRRAINNNNKTLARKNFNKIKYVLVQMLSENNESQLPISKSRLAKFDAFLDSNPLEKWFTNCTEKAWTKNLSPTGLEYCCYGFENFLDCYVKLKTTKQNRT